MQMKHVCLRLNPCSLMLNDLHPRSLKREFRVIVMSVFRMAIELITPYDMQEHTILSPGTSFENRCIRLSIFSGGYVVTL